jgi:hypothetical protein
MNNETLIEQEILNKKLTAPRITPTHIDSVIESEDYYIFPGTTVTICCLTLKNGFNVIGSSAAASADNFDVDIGRKIAFGKARDRIWEYEGYLLKQRLSGDN